MRYEAAPKPDRFRLPPIDHRLRPWLRFLAGLTLLVMTTGFFMSGVTPPGVCGEVLRHNQAEEIDASPLFYSDVEHMAELEEVVNELRKAAKLERQSVPVSN